MRVPDVVEREPPWDRSATWPVASRLDHRRHRAATHQHRCSYDRGDDDGHQHDPLDRLACPLAGDSINDCRVDSPIPVLQRAIPLAQGAVTATSMPVTSTRSLRAVVSSTSRRRPRGRRCDHEDPGAVAHPTGGALGQLAEIIFAAVVLWRPRR